MYKNKSYIHIEKLLFSFCEKTSVETDRLLKAKRKKQNLKKF